MTNPWSAPGQWLKGALHVHTTNSDGKRSPQAVVDAYRECGYDLVAFTDHHTVTSPASVDGRGMVLVGGVEFGAGRSELGARYHIVGLGLDREVPAGLEGADLPEAVDGLRGIGALVHLAHPYWSLLTVKDLLAADFDGIEVFNAGCEYETRHGDSSQHLDWLLARGKRPSVVAVDDSHWGFWDAAGGWTMVKAAERTPEAALGALAAGLSYASTGPVIEDLALEGDALRLECSPARFVSLVTPYEGRGWTTAQACAKPPCQKEWTEVTIPRPTPGKVFRIEVVDAAGLKAWTNPMVIE